MLFLGGITSTYSVFPGAERAALAIQATAVDAVAILEHLGAINLLDRRLGRTGWLVDNVVVDVVAIPEVQDKVLGSLA